MTDFLAWSCFDLTASLGTWAVTARSHPSCALALARRNSKLADNTVAQEPELIHKAEIPLTQNATEKALSGGGAH